MSPDDLSLVLFFDALQKKHIEPGPISHHVLLPATLPPDHDPHFISFEQLNDLLIKCTALNLDVATDLSGHYGPSQEEFQ